MSHNKCSIEIPPIFCDQLKAAMSVEVFENGPNAQEPTNIIRCEQSYDVKVCLEVSALFKRLYCGKWCIKIGVETCGAGVEFDLPVKYIDMTNCDITPDCVTFRVDGSELCRDWDIDRECGKVFHLCVTAVALDSCSDPKPLGIAGFCKAGPFMVY